MAKLLIGTCGYYYPDSRGRIYPPGTKTADRLRLYAGVFPTVELDYAYYQMPTARDIRRKIEESSPLSAQGFLGMEETEAESGAGGRELSFSIKVHKTLTHTVDAFAWKDECKTYLTAIEPLLEAGRLQALLFQFPHAFSYTADNRRYLGSLLGEFGGIPCAVEFRHAAWYQDRVFDGLRERNAALVSLDMPDIPGLPPQVEAVTAPFAYIRFHGRNREAWYARNAGSRY
jgi:uncharacterized protein YecE (DUF72 family)